MFGGESRKTQHFGEDIDTRWLQELLVGNGAAVAGSVSAYKCTYIHVLLSSAFCEPFKEILRPGPAR